MKVTATYIVLIRGNRHTMYAVDYKTDSDIACTSYFIPRLHNNGDLLGGFKQASEAEAKALIAQTLR